MQLVRVAPKHPTRCAVLTSHDQALQPNHTVPPQDCCKALHDRTQAAGTPEELVRARFCALCVCDLEYLVDTCHPESLRTLGTRQASLNYYKRLLNRTKFVGLEDIQVQELGSEVHVFYTAATAEAGTGSVVMRKPYEDVCLMHGGCWVFYSSKAVAGAAAGAGTPSSGGFVLRGLPRFVFRAPEVLYVDTWNGDGRYQEDDEEEEDEEEEKQQ